MSAHQNHEANEPVHYDQERPASENDENEVEDHKKDKYDLDETHPVVGLIIYTVLQFVSLLFVVVATPIEMFVMNREWSDQIWPTSSSGKKICVTAWGMKQGCRSTGYFNRDFTNSFCYRVRTNFKIVEAFCIMTIGFMTLGLIMGVLSIFQKVGKGSTGAIGAFAMVLCIIPWGIVAGMYHQKPCCETNWDNLKKPITTCLFSPRSPAAGQVVARFKEMAKYGAGFGLIVAAWALQVIGCAFAFAPL